MSAPQELCSLHHWHLPKLPEYQVRAMGSLHRPLETQVQPGSTPTTLLCNLPSGRELQLSSPGSPGASPAAFPVLYKLSFGFGPTRGDRLWRESGLQRIRPPDLKCDYSLLPNPLLSSLRLVSADLGRPGRLPALTSVCTHSSCGQCRGLALTRSDSRVLQLAPVVGAAALLQPGVGRGAAVAQRARAAADGGVQRVEVLWALEALVVVALHVHPTVAVLSGLLGSRWATVQPAQEETER